MLGLASLVLACAPVTLRVMVFNVEYGGELVDFGKTVEAIRRAEPDVVLIEEAWGRIPRLARALGWPEHDVRHQVLSKRPLLDPPEADARYLLVEAGPGCAFAVANVHLPSDPEAPDVLPTPSAVEAAMAIERRTRLRALEPVLAALAPLVAKGMPALLGGDFNAPSHQDLPPHPWPTSRALAAAGFADVYRAAHPDAAAKPGFTWWAARPRVPGWNPDPKAAQTRIDQLHAAGAVRVDGASIVGEAGRPGVDIGVEPWPSDHRAVVATLTLTPAPSPLVVTAWPRRVVRGGTLRVRARSTPPGSRLVLVPPGADPAAISAARDASLGELEYPTGGLAAGAHEIVLLDASGRRLAAAPFRVADPGSTPAISGPEAVRAGRPIEARWTNAPGSRWDWVGVYADGIDPQADAAEPLLWLHTRARVDGAVALDASAEGPGWPLKPGTHRLHLFEDDAYEPLASASFVVLP